MLGNSSLNHAKVLLHLKWFVNRLEKSFESKLQTSSSLGRRFSSDKRSTISLWSPKNRNSSSESVKATLARTQLLSRLSNDRDFLSSSDQSPSLSHHESGENNPSDIFFPNKSPAMKVRSLTNSPFMRHIPISRSVLRKRSPLSETSYSNSEIDKSPIRQIFGSHPASNISVDSIGKRPFTDTVFPPFCDLEQLRLLCVLKSSSCLERKECISRFAQHLCVIYEYQIGFLCGLKAVHCAADYVADTIIKGIRVGRISGLRPAELTLDILFDVQCRPSSFSKSVKTAALAGTGEQFTWHLGEMWTRPGVRHNEVGGENCHNLNIITHFLSHCTQNSERHRPDVYGYRNLIVTQAQTAPDGEIIEHLHGDNNCDVASSEVAVLYEDDPKVESESSFYKIFRSDEETILLSNIRTGAPDSSAQSPSALSSPTMAVQSGAVSRPTSYGTRGSGIRPSNPRSPILTGAVTLRQHLHRAYRPVFFVIFERPNVIDHLIECESFAAFCKRQSICPVMFLNQGTNIFNGRVCPSLFQNFDIFCLTSGGYVSNAAENNYALSRTIQTTNRNSERQANDIDWCLNGFDNPGFIS